MRFQYTLKNYDSRSLDGDPIALASLGQPAHGTLTDHGDGTVTYTPDAGYVGSDGFTYTISDGRGGSSQGTVSLSVVDGVIDFTIADGLQLDVFVTVGDVTEVLRGIGVDGAILTSNLLINPGAEDGDLTGWVAVSGDFKTSADGAFTSSHTGGWFFWAGNASSSRMRQDVDVSAYTSEIDAGALSYDFSGWGKGFSAQPGDTHQFTVQELDNVGSVLATWSTTPAGGNSSWVEYTHTKTLEAGTRTLRVRLDGSRSAGASCDAYFDDMSLILNSV